MRVRAEHVLVLPSLSGVWDCPGNQLARALNSKHYPLKPDLFIKTN